MTIKIATKQCHLYGRHKLNSYCKKSMFILFLNKNMILHLKCRLVFSPLLVKTSFVNFK
uniref:Uncharacterized protein n=1 Tax=Phlebia radiata TaxID=5308 RepID=L8B972_PHLRA|nr:hypothetical protein PRA_mt0155 [Phlebia radiata]CCE89227.1 hypothetical protein PRA_mt0155 [Phlebia radiata]